MRLGLALEMATLERPKSWLGCMEGTIKIVGDIVGPTGSLDDWEAGRE